MSKKFSLITVLLPVFLLFATQGQCFADAGQLDQLGPVGRVQIDLEAGRAGLGPVHFDQPPLPAALRKPPSDRGRQGAQHQDRHRRLIGSAKQPEGAAGRIGRRGGGHWGVGISDLGFQISDLGLLSEVGRGL